MQILIVGKNMALNEKVANALVNRGDCVIGSPDIDGKRNKDDYEKLYKNHNNKENQILLDNHITFELEKLVADFNADSNYAEWRTIEDNYKNSLVAIYIESEKRDVEMKQEQELMYEREALNIYRLYSVLNWVIFEGADNVGVDFDSKVIELAEILSGKLPNRLNYLSK